MFKLLKYLLPVMVFIVSNAIGYGQQPAGFSITGTLEGLQDGTMLYLRTTNYIGKRDTIASGRSQGNRFTLTGKLQPENVGRDYCVTIDAKDQRYKKIYNKDMLLYL